MGALHFRCAFGLTIFACSVAVSVAKNLDFPWTSIRLAPAFALAQGLPLYSIPDKPPWVMVGYGPLYPLAYLPATFAHHPGAAVTIATLLAHFYVLAPVGLLCSLLGKNGARESSSWQPHWTMALILFALITHLAPSTHLRHDRRARRCSGLRTVAARVLCGFARGDGHGNREASMAARCGFGGWLEHRVQDQFRCRRNRLAHLGAAILWREARADFLQRSADCGGGSLWPGRTP